jgi:peptide deformylase
VSVKPVRLYIDPILCKPVELVTDFTGLDNIAADLIDTMLAYKGVGLAANQIGLNKNMAVLHLEDKTKILVVANILITGYTEETDVLAEGCLSCPGITVNVKRHLGVRVECQRLSGEKINLEFTGYDARILQHEVDHLNGRLVTDNLMKL